MDRARRASQAVSTLEVHPGHKRVRTAATRANNDNALRRAAINVATTRADWTALAIWTQRIAVSTTMADERHVRFVHARRLNKIEPGIMRELQTRLWW